MATDKTKISEDLPKLSDAVEVKGPYTGVR